jgi:hypothetical protein
LGLTVPRRPSTLTQADVARAIRAAKQTGADGVELRPDGTILIVLKDAPPVLPDPTEPNLKPVVL